MKTATALTKEQQNTIELLRKWIPKLVNERINELDVAQLLVLHYILGHDRSLIDKEDFVNNIEASGCTEEDAERMWGIIARNNYFLMEFVN